jgi:hypothetical protein
MSAEREHLPGKAMVKGTMLHAHLAWATERLKDVNRALRPLVPEACFSAVQPGVLATDWISLRCLVAIDRAIAQAAGPGHEGEFYTELGRHSAVSNLAGVYRNYLVEEPHRFFDKMARLHDRFMNFGHSTYEHLGPRAGRIKLVDYVEYSPVLCYSAVGFYRGALETMHVPGPISVEETSCTCAGAPACSFDLSW